MVACAHRIHPAAETSLFDHLYLANQGSYDIETSAINFIKALCNEEATKKSPFKVDSVRTLLAKLKAIQDALFDLAKDNAILRWRLDESRSLNASFITQFARILAERDAATERKGDRH